METLIASSTWDRPRRSDRSYLPSYPPRFSTHNGHFDPCRLDVSCCGRDGVVAAVAVLVLRSTLDARRHTFCGNHEFDIEGRVNRSLSRHTTNRVLVSGHRRCVSCPRSTPRDQSSISPPGEYVVRYSGTSRSWWIMTGEPSGDKEGAIRRMVALNSAFWARKRPGSDLSGVW